MADRKYYQNRVAIIGSGNVGATFAFTLLLNGLSSEIVLVDVNKARAEGEVMDLNHAIPLSQSARVWSGSYEDCIDAAIVVITAGTAQKPGETRLDLVQRNVTIFKQIIPEVVKNNPEVIIVIATNPVDILTYVAWKLSGLPSRQIIGSGTILDTARFRYLLSEHYGVDPRSIHAYIIGEHGDSEVPLWSLANIAGMRLPEFCAYNGMNCKAEDLSAIFQKTRDAAYQIIERKGATYYAVAVGLFKIVEAILRDQGTVFCVSNYIQNYYGIDDVYLSLPCVLNRYGIAKVLQLELEEEEIVGLRKSADVMIDIIKHLNL